MAVPGLGLSAEFTNRTLDRLPRPSTVVLLPGFGLPASRDAPQSPQELAQLLLARLDDLGYGRAILLGHSASCQIIVEVAAQAPGRVEALVLVGPTTDPRARDWPSLAARWLCTAVWERPGQLPLLLRDYWRTGLGAMSRGIDAARKDHIDYVLTTVEAPVLVVRGPHDRISPRRWADNLAAAAQHGQAQTLSAGAHMLPFTHPDALAASIDAFLRTTAATHCPVIPSRHIAGCRPERCDVRDSEAPITDQSHNGLRGATYLHPGSWPASQGAKSS